MALLVISIGPAAVWSRPMIANRPTAADCSGPPAGHGTVYRVDVAACAEQPGAGDEDPLTKVHVTGGFSQPVAPSRARGHLREL